jgi:KDO2-lipid IV(A) lauroyltransferase
LELADPIPIQRRAGYIAQAVLLGLFLGLCRLLPIDWASAMGGWIGRTVGPRMGQTRKALRNLQRAMPENSPAENARIIRGMWDNLGRTIAEYPHLPRICAQLEGGRVRVDGIENFYALAAHKGPGILFSGHFANWEIAPYLARKAGMSLGLVYRTPNNPWADRLITRFRDAPANFAKGAQGARELFVYLKRGGRAGMLVDQKMNDGIPVPFFGRDAMTAPAIAQLGLRLGCMLAPAWTERLEGARFRIVVHPPLTLTPTGDRLADERALMVRVNQMLEEWIRTRPEQWLWLHRRWPD